MTNNGIVNIHGKDYMTVARRVELAHKDEALECVETEIVSHQPIVVKAKVTIKGKTYSGISAVLPENARTIERQNPYEVAETSAVGRALGFAGYGLVESIASADEMVRTLDTKEIQSIQSEDNETELKCMVCGETAEIKEGISKTGKKYKGIFCSTGEKSHTKWFYAQKS